MYRIVVNGRCILRNLSIVVFVMLTMLLGCVTEASKVTGSAGDLTTKTEKPNRWLRVPSIVHIATAGYFNSLPPGDLSAEFGEAARDAVIANTQYLNLSEYFVKYFGMISMGILRNFGEFMPANGEFHLGIDYRIGRNFDIPSAGAGVVEEINEDDSLGKSIVVNHGNSFYTIYGHLNETLTTVGSQVEQGTIIGKAGSSGNTKAPGVHFAIMYQGEYLNPFLPFPVLTQ